MSNTYIKLHIEKPGTEYRHPNGDVTSSAAGHVWIEVIRPDGSSFQAGFGPADPKGGVSSVPGEIFRDDRESYAGDSYFTATYHITSEQEQTLDRYFNDPSSFGFDKSNYHAATNSCVDFVWKGLEEIGMNPEGYEGNMHPMRNMDAFSKLKNPEMEDGGLVGIERRDDGDQGLEELIKSPLNDMWSGTPNPWVSIIHVPNLHDPGPDIPEGIVEVGPLTEPVPVEEDGSNYADGSSYQ